MQRCVNAHSRQACLPIQPQRDHIALGEFRGAFFGNVDDLLAVFRVNRCGYGDFTAISRDEHALVTGLAATLWIEYRGIEDIAALMHSRHNGLCFCAVGVVAIERLRHAAVSLHGRVGRR